MLSSYGTKVHHYFNCQGSSSSKGISPPSSPSPATNQGHLSLFGFFIVLPAGQIPRSRNSACRQQQQQQQQQRQHCANASANATSTTTREPPHENHHTRTTT
ncbi:hypothetical protein TgHK011_004832 [Trichoderma gracile]|nr:hypothetical protein TgHK011_004832 [Trichoderma gracile]